MKHLGTRRLETARLILRPFTMEDAPAMYRNWASDPEVTKYLTWPAHESIDVTNMVLENWTKSYAAPDCYSWAIVPKELGEPVGSVSVVSIREETEAVEIGYCIAKAWWRRGITSEALDGLITFFFDEVGANRIEARHDPRNPNSGCVMKKCGMTFEGTARQSDRNNQGLCDASWYAIVASDRKER